MSGQSRPLRLLCLHGRHMNAKTFSLKTASLRKQLGDLVELDYLTAPHKTEPKVLRSPGINRAVRAGKMQRNASRLNDAQPISRLNVRRVMKPSEATSLFDTKKMAINADGDYRAWWKPPGDTDSNFVDELEDTLKCLTEALSTAQYDGVLGFSQGATLASLMCTARGIASTGYKPEFCILVAGRRCRGEVEDWYHEIDQEIPTLHMHGTKDKINSPAAAIQLAELFPQPCEVHSYEKGHVFPTGNEEVAAIRSFLEVRGSC